MKRFAEIERTTKETKIQASFFVDGSGKHEITTGIAFFDHMLTLFAVHGFFDLMVKAVGDIEVDYHHTIEDVGLVLGDLLNRSLGERKGIRRYGFAQIPMDDAMSSVTIDLSNRPFLVYELPKNLDRQLDSFANLFKEFFRALTNKAGMNLHIQTHYGKNDHHVTESIFKAFARSLDQATSPDQRTAGILSSKGVL
jgi:imidazoleglycerol-phosphate dehydratase